jgi:plastocyanin
VNYLSAFLCVAFCLAPAYGQGVSVSLRVDLSSSSAARQEPHPGMPSMKPHGAFVPVVAWLTPASPSLATPQPTVPPQTFLLTQKNKQFSPHLLVIPTGSSVEFPNLDPFFHNVFSLFNGRRFDLGLYEAGSRRTVRFDRDGVSYIFCNIHPEMGAVIVSVGTPYYTVSNKDGSLLFLAVPPGDYDLNLWTENALTSDLAAAKQRIHVGSQPVHLQSIALRRSPSQLDQHLNKFGEQYKSTEKNPY